MSYGRSSFDISSMIYFWYLLKLSPSPSKYNWTKIFICFTGFKFSRQMIAKFSILDFWRRWNIISIYNDIIFKYFSSEIISEREVFWRKIMAVIICSNSEKLFVVLSRNITEYNDWASLTILWKGSKIRRRFEHKKNFDHIRVVAVKSVSEKWRYPRKPFYSKFYTNYFLIFASTNFQNLPLSHWSKKIVIFFLPKKWICEKKLLLATFFRFEIYSKERLNGIVRIDKVSILSLKLLTTLAGIFAPNPL
jgi:hypothetical protein